jgi:hypothetical protein
VVVLRPAAGRIGPQPAERASRRSKSSRASSLSRRKT